MLIALVIFALFCIGLLIPIVILVHGTAAKSKWGVNLTPPQCPRCHTAMPAFRVPKSLKQTLWGGWTCPNCACEIDKWGREI